MIQTYVIDIDLTLCSEPTIKGDYSSCLPYMNMVNKVNELYFNGHIIILFTARGMRTYNENLDDIHKFIKPVLVDWLNIYGVQYTKLVFGKPWGPNVHYIDDKNMSFQDFLNQ